MVFVRGTVQGVGFRPFIYRLAHRHSLNGIIINNPQGVEIDVEGKQGAIDKFIEAIRKEAPPLAKIEDISLKKLATAGYTDFKIGETERCGSADMPVAVDVAVCSDCLKEMFDPSDRRYGYAFINCTNCGPRFTIIRDLPYDREFTTMRAFPMCPDCITEYNDPGDRRFHAQPNACHSCGPAVTLRDSSGGIVKTKNPVQRAAVLLADKHILAVKGLGGYHLVCNALDNDTVSALRERKVREDKPFAVMSADINQAGEYCVISDEEAALLETPARPIVLLKKKNNLIAEEVSPGNSFNGMMLPYTPLHHLLFQYLNFPLVMTSGNLSDEPITYEDPDAFMRLGQIADFFLTHNREICHRCDDSVTRIYRGREYLLRRSRGYVPAPITLPWEMGQVLAVGGEQKNTFCLTKGRNVFVSHHIGDLENLETLQAFEREIKIYKKLFNVEPELVAYDMHPEYLSTKYALDLPGIRTIGIQHHHAHIAACMAENGLDGWVLGVAFDGTGFGPDGSIWGGEFLYASLADFKRAAHLKYVPMPGGARAVKEPWRMAAGYLYSQFGSDWRKQKEAPFLSQKNGMLLDALEQVMEKWINCPPTSSMGRFFDAVASIIGIRQEVNYDGQAAIEMEQVALKAEEKVDITYNYVIKEGGPWEIDTEPVIMEILNDLKRGKGPGYAAYRFHHTVKEIITAVCLRAREKYRENRVALSGGVFQNMLLLDLVHRDLEKNGFQVYVHSIVPANDGGISLGQAVIANERRKLGCV
ncbi:MAG: carbamoyltransferase HypF [Firmicutes bacterium HGW-Firmicutes-14]|nr:MAG: carbamoyltransferase HypF [Firmicutes bacterium HGW-Firmicutes-14]